MEPEKGAPFFRPPMGSAKVDPNAVMARATANAIPPTEKHHQTASFSGHKKHMMVLGIDSRGRFAAVLYYTAPHTDKSTTPIEYASLMWLKTEQVQYELACRLRVAAQPDQLDLERVRLGLIRTIDPVLRQPIDKLLKEWEKILRTESKAITTMHVMPRTKPASQFECTTATIDAVTPVGDADSPWSFWLVELPRKAPRREPPGYKQVTGLQWSVTDECVPMVAFTENHVVALYDHRDGAGIVVDCSTLHCHPDTKKWTATRLWMYRIPLPPKEGSSGINYLLRVSEDGTVAWATGYTIWVLDKEPTATTFVRVFQFQTHVCLTSMALCNATRMLTVGTSRGEILAFNWETADDASLDIMLTPLEEPVLAVHRDAATQGRNMALTISAVSGRLVPGREHEFKTLEMERPNAMAAAGERILVSNKYGKVEVYYPARTDMAMRGLLDVPKNIPLVPQTTWDGGVWCNAEGEMAAQMHNGIVHYWK